MDDELFEEIFPAFNDWMATQTVWVRMGIVCGMLWLVAWLVNLWVGWRQKREAGGRVSRWLWVTAVFAGLELAPFLGYWLYYAVRQPNAFPESAFFRFGVVTWVLGIANAIYLLANVAFVFRNGQSRFVLPLLQDEALLNRVAQVSAEYGIDPPRVRELQLFAVNRDALALVGGPIAPSVLVSSGIRNRLSLDEQAAVLAHELAHIANGTLWFLMTLPSFVLLVSGIVSLWLPGSVAIAWGFVLWVGLAHLGSRWFEHDCDRRAAGVCGFRVVGSVLTKIHSLSGLSQRGWLSRLVFATATHPSLSQRIATLRRLAPPDDLPEPVDHVSSEESVGKLSRVVIGVWMAILAGSFWLAAIWPDRWLEIAIGLWVIGVVPWLLILAATWRQRSLVSQLQPKRKPSWQGLVALLILGIIGGATAQKRQIFKRQMLTVP